MFEINTYIMKKKSGKDIKKDNFYLCKDDGFLQYISDDQYMEGMIEILYYGDEIMGVTEWDLVDQLWSYFVEAFIQLKKQDSVEFYFPDQPIKVKMTNLNEDALIFEIGSSKYYLPQKRFIQAMAEEAKHFFAILGYQCELDKTHILLE